MNINQLKYVLAVAKNQSINKASKELFISQPSLSASIKDLEEEIGFSLFSRTSHGIYLTARGEDFLFYARQVVDQVSLMEEMFSRKNTGLPKFSISTQHYSFAVNAFVQLIRLYGIREYEFSIFETRTSTLLKNVSRSKSELGILSLNNFNRKYLMRQIASLNLKYYPLFSCRVHVYLHRSHPLSSLQEIELFQLMPYPWIIFGQDQEGSFFLSEEAYANYPFPQKIHISDRATGLNLLAGLNGFTLCSSIILILSTGISLLLCR